MRISGSGLRLEREKRLWSAVRDLDVNKLLAACGLTPTSGSRPAA
jgi:hypothetical protein